MHPPLDNSAIGQFLQSYDRRDKSLRMWRGLGLCVGTTICLLLAAILLDWLVMLPEPARWALAAIAYLTACLIAWRGCLQPFLRASDPRQRAIEIERLEPTLRDRLLCAVELQAAAGASAGSPRLREISQAKVDAQIRTLDVNRYLPSREAIRGSCFAGGALATLVLLLLLPHVDLPQRLQRVLFPGIDVGRLSQTTIRIETPSPSEGIVPAEETTPVQVVLGGTIPAALQLQSRDAAGDQQQPMQRREGERYALNLPVGKEPLKYRIHAGDSITPWQTLTPRPRPRVVSFAKTLHFPDYANSDPTVRTSDDGGLQAFLGSTAELEMTFSAPLDSAALSVVWDDGEPTTLPLERIAADRFQTSLPIFGSGSYHLELIAAETGFDNPYAATYPIEAVEDLPPQVRFLNASGQPLLRPANDWVPVTLQAEDELPLAMLGYEVAVNGGPWQRTSLPLASAANEKPRFVDPQSTLPPPTAISLSHPLDLLPLNLRVGDSLRLRGVAIDRKRQIAHTAVQEIVIESVGAEPLSREAWDDRLAWAEAIQAWTAAVHAASESAAETLKTAGKDDATPEELPQLDTDALAALADPSEGIIRQTIRLLAETERPLAGAQLEAVGRRVDQIQFTLRDLLASLDRFDAADNRPATRRELERSLRRLARDAERTGSRTTEFIGFDLARGYTAEVYGLLEVLQVLRPASAEQAPWPRLHRYSTLLAHRLAAFDTLIAETSSFLPARSRHLATELRNWLSDRRYRLPQILEQTTDREPAGKEGALRSALAELQQQLLDRTNITARDRGLAQGTVDGLRELDRGAPPLFQTIDRLGEALQRLQAADQAVLSAKDAGQIEQATNRRRPIQSEVERVANGVPVRLRRWATLHQLRPDANARFAADAGLASRAVEAVLWRPDQALASANSGLPLRDRVESIAAIAKDYRQLEAGHRVAQCRIEIEQLIAAERWGSDPVVRRFELPVRWERFRQALEDAAIALRSAQLPAEIHETIDNVRREPPQARISQAFSARRGNRDADEPLFRPLQQIQQKLIAAEQPLQPILAEARRRIAAYVPTISQLAEAAADTLEPSVPAEDAGKDLAAITQSSPSPVAETDEAEPNAVPPEEALDPQGFEQQLERLLDALVEEANLADLGTRDGLQQAQDAEAAKSLLQASQAALQQTAAEAAEATSGAANPDEANPAETSSAEAALQASQQQMLDHLEIVQQHFATPAENAAPPAGETPSPLMAAIQEAGLDRENRQRFGPLEQLVEASEQDPQTLLQQLESELQRNPAMQEALSDISRTAVDRVQNALQAASARQAAMQREIESADSDYRETKEPIVKALRTLADRVSEMERTLISQAEKAAHRGDLADLRDNLRAQRQRLDETVTAAKNQNADTLMADLRQTAEEVSESLGEVARQLQKSSDQASVLQETPTEEDAGRRRPLAEALKKENRRLRDRRVQDAEKRLRSVQREVTDAEQRTRTAQRKLQKVEDQLAKPQQEAEQQPDARARQQAVDRLQQQRAQARQQAQDARTAQQQAQAKRDRHEAWLAEAQATPQPSLQSVHPAAENTQAFAQAATSMARQLHQQAVDVAEAAAADTAPAPPENHLRSATSEQGMVRQQVQGAAQDLARSARHERRLGQEASSEQLQSQADQVASVNRNEVASAQQELDGATTAAEQAAPAAAPPATPPAVAADAAANQAGSPAAAAPSQAAVAARDALQVSEAALRQRQQDLAALAAEAPNDGLPDGPAPAASPGGENPPAATTQAASSQPDRPSPELLAQTLDQLDQQLASPGQPASAGQPSQQAAATAAADGPVPPRFPSRLQSEARSRGRQLAQQRTAASQSTASSPQGEPTDPATGSVASGSSPDSSSEPFGRLPPPERGGNGDWGQLGTMTVDNAADGENEALHRAYRGQLEAYFRVLAERSRQQPPVAP